MQEMRCFFRRAFCRMPSVASSISLCSVFSGNGVFSLTPRHFNSFHYRKVRSVTEDVANPLHKTTELDKGALHVVSVPIGNLKDFTYRAVDVLRGVDYIVTSDRPATKTLLDLVQIPNQGRLIHYSAENKAITSQKLVEMLRGGRSMALVTTSGTPCIGDIGAELVQAMLKSGVRVTSVPGASPVLAALSCCGETRSPYEQSHFDKEQDDQTMKLEDYAGIVGDSLPGAFFFGNMLPSSPSARLRVLRNVVGPAAHPCVFYEVPRRLLLTLEDIASVLPGRRVYITHELTKLNESIHSDQAEKLLIFYRRMEAQPLVKLGQLVLVIAGATSKDIDEWIKRITERRRQFRPNVVDLLTRCCSFSSDNEEELRFTGVEPRNGMQKKRTPGHRKKASRGKIRRNIGAVKEASTKFSDAKRLRRAARLEQLRKIEEAQESLRLSIIANRMDSQKFS